MIKFLVLTVFFAGWSGICSASVVHAKAMVADTIPSKKETVKEQQKEKTVPQKKEVKAVPKAKNQSKPKPIVVRPVKMKPVKIIRPKITGKGLGK